MIPDSLISDNLEDYDNNIDYNDFLIPISKVTEGMQNIVVSGKVVNILGLQSFNRKNGTQGHLRKFQLCDNSDCINIVLWGEQTKLMDNKLFQIGAFVQIIGGYSKNGLEDELEIHLSKQGKLILQEKRVSEMNIVLPSQKNISSSKLNINQIYNKEGFIPFVLGVVHLEEFKSITLKTEEETFLLKFSLSDDTGTIKVIVWGKKAVELGKFLIDGDKVQISNVKINFNSFLNEKELSLTRNSQFKALSN
jgi:replication factor A1